MVLQLYTFKQAAELLNVSEAFLRKWRRQGKIRVVKLGRCVRIRESDLVSLQKWDGDDSSGCLS